MLGAAVPEAAIHEDRHTGTREDDVGFPPQARDGSLMKLVPQALPVERLAEGQLWTGVPPALHLHPRLDRGAGREGATLVSRDLDDLVDTLGHGLTIGA